MGVENPELFVEFMEFEVNNNTALPRSLSEDSVNGIFKTSVETYAEKEYVSNPEIMVDSESSNASDEVNNTNNENRFVKWKIQEGENVPSSETVRYFDILAEGKNVVGDSQKNIDTPPQWFDIDKFRKGQKFAMERIFGLMYAQLVSLFILFSGPNALDTLIFTGNSDTPYKAFKRYLSTTFRIKSWYEGDFWDKDSPARRNIKVVRFMHAKVREQMSSCPAQKLQEKLFLKSHSDVWSTKLKLINKDFSSLCPFALNINSFSQRAGVFVTQSEMAVTQFAFVGLMVLYPEKFGAPDATKDDLECFAHLWKTIGYCLGIEDKYNFCNGSLDEIKQRSLGLIDMYFKPSMRNLTTEWEHMSRCLIEGISYYMRGCTFEVPLYYMSQVLGIHAPRLYESLNALQRLSFAFTWFFLTYLSKFHWARTFFNWIALSSLNRAQTGSKKWLKSLENRMYPYQNATQMCAAS